MMKLANEDIIKKVLALELKMFLSVPSIGQSSCQNYPESFKLHRKAQFSCWSRETLESYLRDLEKANGKGINLMTHKYARMDDLIPPLNSNPLIDAIVGYQCAWQRAMVKKYPGIMSGGRPLSSAEDSAFLTSFETYLRGELETYSDATLELLNKDILSKKAQGINMAEELYLYLVKEKGYDSLDEAEQESSKTRI
ncbi:MAG: DUF4125 family protein [Syntrophaceae bacterium]|nr:DUF4125 family protein [Syntrophaceae bacterium]